MEIKKKEGGKVSNDTYIFLKDGKIYKLKMTGMCDKFVQGVKIK